MSEDKQIIFFDGVCNLCNAFVDFLLKRDQDQLFLFAPLQGRSAAQKLPDEVVGGLKSVSLWSQGQVFQKSDAALMILQQLGGAWWCMRVFWAVPSPLRDLVYDLVAAKRYALFGRRETCRLPTPAERARFLD